MACAAAAVTSCALPYPSDEWSGADPGSPTGRRLHVPDSLIDPAVLRQMGPGATLDDAFAGADGYSALSPVIFELDRPMDPDALPADGGGVVEVYDLADGHAVPVKVELPFEALRRGRPATVVQATPRIRWEYGHTYVARLARVHGPLGDPEPPAAVAGSVGGYMSSVRADLAEVDPIPWELVLSATRFSVGSRQGAIGDLERMADIARAADHPVRALEALPPAFVDHASAILRGEVRVSDFRDDDGVARSTHPVRDTWVPFLVVVPQRPASAEGAPLVVYGHGLTINKESMAIVAGQNAEHGLATIGIDVPNHGERQAGANGGYLLDITTPRTLGRLLSMPTQGIVDHVSLVSAIVHHLGQVDLAPWAALGPPGDGRVDLDTSTLLYEGTSMGGVLGAAEFALIPELRAAFLEVAGSGTFDILTHSILWPWFAPVIPDGAGAGDALGLMGAATMLTDRSDNTHLLDDLRRSGRPVFVQVGAGDHIVPNEASERLVGLLGLPRVGRQLTSIPAPSAGDDIPADGRGFAEVWPMDSSPDTQGFMAHVSFSEPASTILLSHWLDQQLAAAGLA